jgi:tripartite-type tricarboxylate transporter receptor subunit TctC
MTTALLSRLGEIARAIVVGAAPLLLLVTPPVLAQSQPRDWPTRTVRVIVPSGTGSGLEIGARLTAERLARNWSQPVTVETKPGGDSIVAINTLVGATDDHTLLWAASASLTAHPYTHARMAYDARQLVPIVRVSTTLVSIAVANDIKATTMAELVAAARVWPGKLRWASVSGLPDLLFQAFVKEGGLDMVRVPYGDAAQAAGDLAEGRVQAYVSVYAISRPLIESGRIRPIAFTNTSRAPVMSNIPTVREAGYPAMELDGMVGIWGTQVHAENVRRKISTDVRSVLTDSAITERLAAAGQMVSPGDSEQFVAALAKQGQAAASAARILGIRPAE